LGTPSIINIKDSSERATKMREKIEKALARVRTSLQADGGDVELVEVSEEGVVKVKLSGTCQHCPLATMTLKAGIERTLKKEVPEIKRVEAV